MNKKLFAELVESVKQVKGQPILSTARSLISPRARTHE